MIGYHMGDSSAYRFVVAPDGRITWTDLGNPAELTKLVGDWKEALLQGWIMLSSIWAWNFEVV